MLKKDVLLSQTGEQVFKITPGTFEAGGGDWTGYSDSSGVASLMFPIGKLDPLYFEGCQICEFICHPRYGTKFAITPVPDGTTLTIRRNDTGETIALNRNANGSAFGGSADSFMSSSDKNKTIALSLLRKQSSSNRSSFEERRVA